MRQRLLARGRESAQQIEARLARSQELQLLSRSFGEEEARSLYLLDNSGPLEQTVTQLLQLLSETLAYA